MLAAASGCAGSDAGGVSGERETLADGTIVVTHAALPDSAAARPEPDLRIGRIDGPAEEIFGQIVGLDVAADGTIYVLDFQGREVRAFGPDGAYRTTLARGGEGPGELRRPSGIAAAPDGTVWVRDDGAGALIGLAPTGGETARHPLPNEGGGAGPWDGRFDDRGAIWQTWGYTERAAAGLPAEGVSAVRRSHWARSFAPTTGATDSLPLGDEQPRFLVIPQGRGYISARVPYDPALLVAYGPDGTIWTASSDAYRVTRRDPAGGADLVIRGSAEGPPLTTEERDRLARLLERAGVPPEVPERHPPLLALSVDDEGRLWVQRRVPSEAGARFDVFGVAGELLGSVVLPAGSAPSPSPVVRGGRIYWVTLDELGVAYVVGAPLPPLAS